MADVHTREQRRYNMQQIKGKNTRPEMLVRSFLHKQGYRYRLHQKDLPGKPDIVLPKYQTVIFIHGCFWHAHTNCKYFKLPATRTDWWLSKLTANTANDNKAEDALQQMGWKVIIIWECDLKPDKLQNTLQKLIKDLN